MCCVTERKVYILILNITPSNRSSYERILDSFLEIKGKDVFNYRQSSHLIKVEGERVLGGMCLYPSMEDNPVRYVLGKLKLPDKELIPGEDRWDISEIVRDSSTKDDKQFTTEIIWSLMNFGIDNGVSAFLSATKSIELREDFEEQGIPMHMLYPRIGKELVSGMNIGRVEVTYSAIRLLERKFEEDPLDGFY